MSRFWKIAVNLGVLALLQSALLAWMPDTGAQLALGPLAAIAGLAAVGAVVGGVRAHNKDEPVWKGAATGALLGGGLGAGAAGLGLFGAGGAGAGGMGGLGGLFGGGAGGGAGAGGLLSRLPLLGGGAPGGMGMGLMGLTQPSGGAAGSLGGMGGGGAGGGGFLSSLGGLFGGGGAGGLPVPTGINPAGQEGLNRALGGVLGGAQPGAGGLPPGPGGGGGFWDSLRDFLGGSAAESRRQEDLEQQLQLINAANQRGLFRTDVHPAAINGLPQPLSALGAIGNQGRLLGGGLNF